MTDSLKAAARAGDIKALEALMNKSFESKGVTVRVTNSGALLKIVVRGKESPDKALLSTIQKGLASINPSGFDQVIVTARPIGKVDAWSQKWDLPRDEQAESFPVAGSLPQEPKPAIKVLAGSSSPTFWYQKNWLIISLLIIFPLAGIPLAWMSKWPKANKIGASVVGGLWLLSSLLIQQFNETQTTTAQEGNQNPVAGLATEPESPKVNELPVSIVVDPEKFVAAARDGNLTVIKAILTEGISPDTTNEQGTSALSMAAGKGHLEIVQAIVAEGPSQAIKDDALGSASTGPLEIVIFLLEQGANPRAVNTNWLGEPEPVLLSAAEYGTPDHVKALLAAGASWDQINQQQANEALLNASCDGWVFTVKELLAIGADPNYKNDFDETPLMLASSETCRTFGIAGEKLAPGSRQHDQTLQILKAAGAK
jgi:hypothetical protein